MCHYLLFLLGSSWLRADRLIGLLILLSHHLLADVASVPFSSSTYEHMATTTIWSLVLINYLPSNFLYCKMHNKQMRRQLHWFNIFLIGSIIVTYCSHQWIVVKYKMLNRWSHYNRVNSCTITNRETRSQSMCWFACLYNIVWGACLLGYSLSSYQWSMKRR